MAACGSSTPQERALGDHALVQVAMQLGELGPYLGLVPAVVPLTDAIAVRIEPERDGAAPAAWTVPMVSWVAAVSDVLKVDRVLAVSPALGHAQSAATLAPSLASLMILIEIIRASDLVELSGLEPLTPCLQSRCSSS